MVDLKLAMELITALHDHGYGHSEIFVILALISTGYPNLLQR